MASQVKEIITWLSAVVVLSFCAGFVGAAVRDLVRACRKRRHG